MKLCTSKNKKAISNVVRGKKMKKGAFAVLMCYVLWGILPIFWKLLNQLDPVYILASRIFWSLIFCFVLIIFKKELLKIKEVIKNKKEILLLCAAGGMVSINWGSYIWAVNNNHILEASLAYYMNPIITILMGFACFKEKLNKNQWISVVIAFICVMIPIIRYGQVPYLAVIIGGSFAIYGAIKKMVKAESQVSLIIETAAVTPIAIVYIIYAEINGIGAIGVIHNPMQFLLLPLAGIITAVPLLLFAQGIKSTPYSLAGILMYVNPTLQLLIGVILYKEKFTAINAITFGFIWIALIIFLMSNMDISKKTELA